VKPAIVECTILRSRFQDFVMQPVRRTGAEME
jgi:hypothetical protein